ncbi:phosphoglycerate mutase-like protein [Viridothelium virens]|uniref:Phosphoglycerate mutase-like protein n=1 Tax=Viridothelium virens TaxID=1048519 RepID=A0A6A6HLJ3_VIRVR|nr:phosphoglycerate mutase-like protein [Viridothelium virens]
MGKPRMIILVRHAQSEGNKNREVHQMIPDHRVKLTQEGRNQAEEAGRRLKGLLRPDDTLQFFTSPYRRTRETTEGILKSLCGEDGTPSPFPRHAVKVYEEPRLREQDFGNFQPCSAEMERMWQERADYGHFFYRIPNGESAADAYDRVSGFNESLWRSFGEQDFPSVCVLVTHGLMTRVFLMKWYHWSVEYFEDLRNINHCEFIVMKRNEDNGKYALQNELRTWSELKRRAAANEAPRNSISSKNITPATQSHSPVAVRKWGGCAQGCNHHQMNFPRRTRRQNTQDFQQPAATIPESNEKSDHPIAPKTNEGDAPTPKIFNVTSSEPTTTNAHSNDHIPDLKADQDASSTGTPADDDASGESSPISPDAPDARLLRLPHHMHPRTHRPSVLRLGRDFGGSRSGAVTPADVLSDDSDYFSSETGNKAHAGRRGVGVGASVPMNLGALSKKLKQKDGVGRGGAGAGKTTEEQEQEWAEESGMGSGARADALGDQTESSDVDTGGEETPGTGRSAVSEVELAEMRDKSVRGSVY